MDFKSLEELQNKLEKNGKESIYNKKYCALVVSVFDNPMGKQLIDTWKDILINQTTYNPSMPKEAVFIAEGQHNFIRHILTSMDLHKKGAKK